MGDDLVLYRTFIPLGRLWSTLDFRPGRPAGSRDPLEYRSGPFCDRDTTYIRNVLLGVLL
jgi:hypothetical protein